MSQSTPTVRFQSHAPIWTGLIPLLILLQLLFPSPAWMALLVGMGGAWLLAFVWVHALAGNLHLEREMRFGWAHVGDRLEERFTLINIGLIPALWVEITDLSTLPDYHISQVTAIGSNTHYSWKTSQACTRRGMFTLGPTRLRAGDPLGLFSVSIDLPGFNVLMVMPAVVPLPAIEIAPAGRAGEGHRARPDPIERTVSTNGVRQYLSGDPKRWIHWPLSLHHQQLYVRTFDSTPTSDWWIFLDLDKTVQIGEGWNSTEEHAVILAASLADRGLREGHAVGLAAAGEELVWLRPENTSEQRMDILRSLALVKSGNTHLAQLLQSARPDLHRGFSLILITPSMDQRWLEPLARLARGRLIPTVLLFEPASYGAAGEIKSIQSMLTSLGTIPFVIRRDLLDRPEARPGHEGEWEWRVTGLGRAIPVRKPTDMSWRKVGG